MKLEHIVLIVAIVVFICVGLPCCCLIGIVFTANPQPPDQQMRERQVSRNTASSTASPIDIRRSTYQTKLTIQERDTTPMPMPPRGSDFSLVKYPTDIGDMSAYLCIPSGDEGKDANGKRPAIVWITGGMPPGGGGSFLWGPVNPANDQAASAYSNRGIIMMFPALRGAAGNPGVQESFYGEVDDVIAAGRFLQNVEGVDPERVYLGGHSTGGTLVLLVAATTDLFCEVISIGPVDDPINYGTLKLTYAATNQAENARRSPKHFMNQLKSLTHVYEGGHDGNADAVRELARHTHPENDMVTFEIFRHHDHFTVLDLVNQAVAERIVNAPDRKRLPQQRGAFSAPQQ